MNNQKTFKEYVNEAANKEYISINLDGNCVWSMSIDIPQYVNWNDENDREVKAFYKELNKANKLANKEISKLKKEGFSPYIVNDKCWGGTR